MVLAAGTGVNYIDLIKYDEARDVLAELGIATEIISNTQKGLVIRANF